MNTQQDAIREAIKILENPQATQEQRSRAAQLLRENRPPVRESQFVTQVPSDRPVGPTPAQQAIETGKIEMKKGTQ